MAEQEHACWEEMVRGKETQVQGLREHMEQLEAGLEQARRDILPQLRIHKVLGYSLPEATPLTARSHTPHCHLPCSCRGKVLYRRGGSEPCERKCPKWSPPLR